MPKTPLEQAREGDIDALSALASEDARSAYRWLLVAVDLGHEDAAEALGDLEEHYNELKYDDDGLVRREIHFELARAYLLGELGLPVDLALGRGHLEAFLDGASPDRGDVGGAAQVVSALSAELDGEARRAVEACLVDQPFRAVRRRIERMSHLHDLNRGGARIPTAVLEAESAFLREEVERAIAALRRSGD